MSNLFQAFFDVFFVSNSVVGETREARERREIKEKEKPKKRVNFAEDKK
jgi:hypothetical protein